jgi:hypothetical protein
MSRTIVLSLAALVVAAGLARADDYQGIAVRQVNAGGFQLSVAVPDNGQMRNVTLLYGPITRGVNAAGNAVAGNQILNGIVGVGDTINAQTRVLADSPRFGRVEALLYVYPSRQ